MRDPAVVWMRQESGAPMSCRHARLRSEKDRPPGPEGLESCHARKHHMVWPGRNKRWPKLSRQDDLDKPAVALPDLPWKPDPTWQARMLDSQSRNSKHHRCRSKSATSRKSVDGRQEVFECLPVWIGPPSGRAGLPRVIPHLFSFGKLPTPRNLLPRDTRIPGLDRYRMRFVLIVVSSSGGLSLDRAA
jgi:hypothetical protein